MPGKKRLQHLYHRFISDAATADEVREFWALMEKADENDPIKDAVFELYKHEAPEELGGKDWGNATRRIVEPEVKSRILPIRKWWWAAAAVLVLVAGYGYFQFGQVDHPQGLAKVPDTHDVAAPETNRATITLADGRMIALQGLETGLVAIQKHIKLTKEADGKVVYDLGAATAAGPAGYNTISNPRGSKMLHLSLSDGTLLWLNAGSSVTLPVAFDANERRITIQGEAYLEVAHDPTKKFIVMAKGIQTEVLGTHFNVHAYEGEDPVRITLLEGSLRVTSPEGRSVVIIPGDEAEISKNGSLKVKLREDAEGVIAWKNEMFWFNESGIREIMKDVSRWYDVEVEYKGDIGDLSFGGNMSRQKNISELLQRLEATKEVKFEVKGKTVIVSQTD